MTCKDCLFSKAKGVVFECWRYPPTPQAVLAQRAGVMNVKPIFSVEHIFSLRPIMNSQDWCGEYAQRVNGERTT